MPCALFGNDCFLCAPYVHISRTKDLPFSPPLSQTLIYLTAYWGRIIDINDQAHDANTTEAKFISPTMDSKDPGDPKTVEINGSVLDGWGLEPIPVARFTMIEETQEYDEGEDEDEDEDDEAELFRQSLENYADFGGGNDGVNNWNEKGDDEIDPFSSAEDAFQ